MTAVVTMTILAALPGQAQQYQSPLRLAQAPSYYDADDGDPLTSVHERTHWVNSQLRIRYGGAGLYLGQGRFLWIPDRRPGITLGQVARYVQHRGMRFRQYLELSRYPLTPRPMGPGTMLIGHEQDPLHLFDELSAYMAAAAVAVQQGPRDPDRVRAACEMAHYAAACYHATPTSWPHRETLRRIWVTMALQLDLIARDAARRGMYQGVGPWHHELVREIRRMRGF